MRRVPSKVACTLAVAGLGAAAVAGCGNDVPPNAVAKVGDTVITKSDFDRWLRTAAQGQSQSGQAAVPDPPNYSKCVAAKQSQPLPKGAKKPDEAQLKKQCKQDYDQLKGEVMQFLIQAQWVQQEANAQNIKVSDAEVRRSLEDQKKQAFPNEKAYQRFLKTSGMTEKDILFRVKLDTLQQKLTQKVTQQKSKVSQADVEAYYEKNRKRFSQPERRDLKVVLAKTKARALAAERALRRGQSWKAVVKRYSIDQASKSAGGSLPDVPKGQQDKPFDAAIFKAKKGRVEGPVKTQFGYYVFEVTKVTPASQQSLGEAKDTIRNLLRSQRQQKALDDWIKDFRNRYRDKTTCADSFKISECKNGPKPKTNTGGASGGNPGGQAQPQQSPNQQQTTP